MIRKRTFSIAALLIASTFSAPHPLTAQAADNSRQNKAESPTADNQGSVKSDRLTTAQIRKANIADKGLSTYPHNIKIIVQNGKVTLKGPVKSDEEKQKVLADAGSVAASGPIADQITVKQ
jgi:hyperosmotically inducible protein